MQIYDRRLLRSPANLRIKWKKASKLISMGGTNKEIVRGSESY